jgi:large subunit ribosomal protein L23
MEILIHPYATEKATTRIVEVFGQLQFIVIKEATKTQIKVAIEKAYGYKVTKIQTAMTNQGTKKATISFENPKAAEEILSKLGIM